MENHIRELRLKNDMTQQQLADYLGVTRGAVSQWETGEFNPRMGTVQRIAGLFKVEISDVIGNPSRTDLMSFEESQLVYMYRQLNARGKQQLIEQAQMMVESGRYAEAKNIQGMVG